MGLNKTTLVNAVADETNMSKVDTEKAIKSTINVISQELAKGGEVKLIGFGTFSVIKRAARMGKNPRTGEEIKIPAKKSPKFKPGQALVDMVNKK